MLIFARLFCKCKLRTVLIFSIMKLRCSVAVPPQLIQRRNLFWVPCWTQNMHATRSRSGRATFPFIPVRFSTRRCCYMVLPIPQQQASQWAAGDGREYITITVSRALKLYVLRNHKSRTCRAINAPRTQSSGSINWRWNCTAWAFFHPQTANKALCRVRAFYKIGRARVREW